MTWSTFSEQTWKALSDQGVEFSPRWLDESQPKGELNERNVSELVAFAVGLQVPQGHADAPREHSAGAMARVKARQGFPFRRRSAALTRAMRSRLQAAIGASGQCGYLTLSVVDWIGRVM